MRFYLGEKDDLIRGNAAQCTGISIQTYFEEVTICPQAVSIPRRKLTTLSFCIIMWVFSVIYYSVTKPNAF